MTTNSTTLQQLWKNPLQGFRKVRKLPAVQRLNFPMFLRVVKSSLCFSYDSPIFPKDFSHGSKTQQPSFPNKKKKHHDPSTKPPSHFCPQGFSIPKTSFATKQPPSGVRKPKSFILGKSIINPYVELRPFPSLGGFPCQTHHFGVTYKLRQFLLKIQGTSRIVKVRHLSPVRWWEVLLA